VAPARVTYMIGCLAELQDRYGEIGGELLILKGNPETQLPTLAKALNAAAVYWNRDVEPYSRDRDTRVAAALKAQNIEIKTQFWDQLLHAPGDVMTGADPPTPFMVPFGVTGKSNPKPPLLKPPRN
jgi:deoxyribodipyrimidine photo-lyase